MARRRAVVVDVTVPADGGESPNAYMPYVTAQIRLHWPPRATREQVEEALVRAIGKARREFDQQTGRPLT